MFVFLLIWHYIQLFTSLTKSFIAVLLLKASISVFVNLFPQNGPVDDLEHDYSVFKVHLIRFILIIVHMPCVHLTSTLMFSLF